MTIGVIEKPESRFSACLAQILKKCDNCAETIVKTGSRPDTLSRVSPELMVIYGEVSGARDLVFPDSVMLVPKRGMGRITAKGIYTYGMGEDDDVTYSSLGDMKRVISLQTEITALTGKTVEPQDIPFTQIGDMDADELLAATAALTILGVPPEKLRSVM